MADASLVGPAYYARRGGPWADVHTLLHPPYTAWHLSYVVIGAALAPNVDVIRLVGSLVVFFLAVGIAAHALDELHGRPLSTAVPGRALVAAAACALLGAAVIGVMGVRVIGMVLVPVGLVGLMLVLAYNLELGGGHLHTLWGFAAGWGAYPVIVGNLVQTGSVTIPALAAAAGAVAMSVAQRALSTPARLVRRRALVIDGRLTVASGDIALTRGDLLRPLEQALRALCWAACFLATGLVLTHWR